MTQVNKNFTMQKNLRDPQTFDTNGTHCAKARYFIPPCENPLPPRFFFLRKSLSERTAAEGKRYLCRSISALRFVLRLLQKRKATVPDFSFRAVAFKIKCKELFTELRFFVFEILIEVTGDHAVIEFSYFIGTLPVQTLEVRMRGDDIDLPRGKGAKMRAHLPI